MLFENQNTPRWLIFLIDISICTIAVLLAYLLRFNFSIPEKYLTNLIQVTSFVLLIRAISFILSKVYAGIIRYTSTQDVIRIFLVNLSGSLFFGLTNVVLYYFFEKPFFIPFSVIIIDFIAATLAMTFFRILVKVLYMEIGSSSKSKTNVIIYGAGETGVMAKRALDQGMGNKIKVLAYIDDNPIKQRKNLGGVQIVGFDKMPELITENEVEQVVIAIPKISVSKKNEIVELCLKNNTRVLSVPPVGRWVNGELSFHQLKQIRIEDLLGREEIKIDNENIHKGLKDKTILVTGAAGSIGSELVRQISHYSPKKILLLDQAETPLYLLELEMYEKFNHINHQVFMCDITSEDQLGRIFDKHKPDIIFHAAAYKHVPMVEGSPAEAILTNVMGTKILANLADRNKLEKFVMISTDKAVNPTSVMGASKRLAEIYTQSLSKRSKTQFITTRFGNVLGSNGSVIPLFKKQIEQGGPVTITHKEVTRYFMTIPEACQLVLEASTMAKGGEIYLFDMGESVKIVDLARKMIKLSGLKLGKDIQITYTGLRPGEKLYEELLNEQENTIDTHHPQIMIAKVREYSFDEVSVKINDLINKSGKVNRFELVKDLKDIIPEYVSQNSIFEQLDEK